MTAEMAGLAFKVTYALWLRRSACSDCDWLVGTWARTGTLYGSNGKENGDDDGDDDDLDLLTIEELRNTILQEKGFATEDWSPDNTVRGVKEVASEERRLYRP
jgi:hypothetical protein